MSLSLAQFPPHFFPNLDILFPLTIPDVQLKPFRIPAMQRATMRAVKGIFVIRDRPLFFPVKCEMAIFFPVNRDFYSSLEP